MPIITSSIPEMNSAVNVAEENLSLIQRKLTEARDICKDVFDGSRTWQDLFQTRLFFHEFEYFLEVTARAKTDLCMWFGLVESKLRTLCVMIRTCPRIQQVQIWPIPFPGTKGAIGGFSQSWYIGCRFQEKGEGSVERMKEVLESPLRNFSSICEESVRRLAHYPTNAFQTSWTLLLQSRLPSNVTDMLRKKPSYASVTQGLETQRLGNIEQDVSGHILPREDVVRLKTPSPYLGLHGNRAQGLDPLAPIMNSTSSLAGSQYYSTIASPLHDHIPGSQYIQGRMLYTPSTSSIIYSTSSRNMSANMSGYRDLRPSPTPVFTSILPVAPTDTYPTYPPVTSLPPPYSPANLFTSPPPPHGMTLSPALCKGCSLPSPGCKCHSPRSRTDCGANYQDVSGQSCHSGMEPRTVRLFFIFVEFRPLFFLASAEGKVPIFWAT